MKAHEKQLIIGMYLDLTQDTIAKKIQFKLIATGPAVGHADLNIFFKT
jgi:hypothetical protein